MPEYALIVIDMLNDFISGGPELHGTRGAVQKIKLLLETARSNGIPVIHANDAHVEGDPELAIWGRHAMKGTMGSEVIDELAPIKGDYVFEKHVYSAFQNEGLDQQLRSLAVTSIVLTGTLTHICVMSTAADAFFRGYEIIVAEDRVVDNNAEDHGIALRYMKELYRAKILQASEISKIFNQIGGILTKPQ